MDLDELFKKPALPSNKRKSNAARDPNEIYKSAKLAPNGHAKSNGKQPAVSEPEDEDIEAGPSAPPDDEDYGPDIPDDEEGRFFGGGVSKEENEILDYMEGQEEADVAPIKYDSAWLRKFARGFEEKISKNAEMRIKFEDQPEKFMESEANLDDSIKAIGILCQNMQLYTDFAELGCAASLVGLLAHENTDIAISAIRVIAELLGDDNEVGEGEETVTDENGVTKYWDTLANSMLDADLASLVLSNLGRFDESNESDRDGISDAIAIFTHLANGQYADKIMKDTETISWLLKRIEKKSGKTGSAEIQESAAEALAIYLQVSSYSRQKLLEMDGVDRILQLIAKNRRSYKADDSSESSYMENLFDILTAIVFEPLGKQKFSEAEGVELCIIILRDGTGLKSMALKLLDHAMTGQSNPSIAQALVESAGLKVIFSMFNKKHEYEETEHLLGIFSSLMKTLPAEDPARIRTLAKFMEKEYKTIDKLIKLRRGYIKTCGEREGAEKQEWLDVGGEKEGVFTPSRDGAEWFCLRAIDVLLAWLVAEDDGAGKKIKGLLAEQDEGFGGLRRSLQEQIDEINADTEEANGTRDMLKTLSQFLT